jgi:hypothetical protein
MRSTSSPIQQLVPAISCLRDNWLQHMGIMAPLADGLLAARQVPDGIESLTIPPGIDRHTFLLSLPAFLPAHIPWGADRTMTVDGPDQFWFLLVAILCIAIPGLFLLIRVYTKVAVVRSLEVADCE